MLAGQDCKTVTSEVLGRAKIPDLPYEQPDGTPLRIGTDYFGKSRKKSNPVCGPFGTVGQAGEFKVWPIKGEVK